MATSGGVGGALDLKVLISAQNLASPELAKLQADVANTTKQLQVYGQNVTIVTGHSNQLSDSVDGTRGLGRHFTALAAIRAERGPS